MLTPFKARVLCACGLCLCLCSMAHFMYLPALSKRLTWVKKAAKAHKSSVNQLSDDAAAPLHYAVANCGRPDATEAKIARVLLAAGAEPNIR